SPGDRDVHDVAALGVGAASEEGRARAALAHLHWLAALLARGLLDLRHVHRVFLGIRDVLRERAARVPAARDEEAVLAHAKLQLFAAVGALLSHRGHTRDL